MRTVDFSVSSFIMDVNRCDSGMLVNQKIGIIKKEKGLSTAKLAKKTGINSSVISRYESGIIKYIPVEQLKKIADAFDMTLDELTEGDIRYIPGSYEDSPQKRVKPYSKTEILSDDDREVLYCYHLMPEQAKAAFRYLCQIMATGENKK